MSICLSGPDPNLKLQAHGLVPSLASPQDSTDLAAGGEKMKVPMGPPPSRSPESGAASTAEAPLEPLVEVGAMDSSEAQLDLPTSADSSSSNEPEPDAGQRRNPLVPYSIPPWSEPPLHPFFLEVLRDGSIIDQLDVSAKGAFMFGRVDLCDFVLEHPTISRFHAVLQFKGNGDAFLYDLGSTHGSFINKKEVKKKVYTELHVGDVIRFGQSSRLYIFQGPSELMPPVGNSKMQRKVKVQEEMEDREASIARAKLQASLAEGISWGMAEDAIEEATEDVEEITWQTHKGQLTERQEKLREKILKRMEKIANMKKEIDAIRAKDISQGGLTQGQQTQIARNEQRTSQIIEELESLEETLNDSIQESLGARGVKSNHAMKKGVAEDEDDVLSDEDEFYDRTKKKSSNCSVVEEKQVETADSLLDKKEAIIRDIEEKSNLLLKEKNKVVPDTSEVESGDALDAYMTGLSTQLVLDTAVHLEKEISALQTELDRILYLLKFADPTGDVVRRRESKMQMETSVSINKQVATNKLVSDAKKKSDKQKNLVSKESVNDSSCIDTSEIVIEKPSIVDDVKSKDAENNDEKPPGYSLSKPMWLGDTASMEVKDNQPNVAPVNIGDSDGFIDYKDRKKILDSGMEQHVSALSSIEYAAPGLIIRKRKEPETTKHGTENPPGDPVISSTEADSAVADAVALLLKHERGFSGLEHAEDVNQGGEKEAGKPQTKRQSRRVGPEKPDFLDANPDYDTWVPPQGQSGDGRTFLNERYGY